MATYNLAAGDLITLLNSTATSHTANAILSNLLAADNGVLTALTGVQTTEGPSDVRDPNFPVDQFDVVLTPSTAGYPIQLELITVPTSTTTGSAYVPGAAGTTLQTALTAMNVSTSGGIVIGAGDQFVSLIDYNSGGTADTVVGGAYKERLISNTGSNVLIGGTGANTLIGGSGADTLIGGGDSRLVAGLGFNVLKSSKLSSGHDTLVGSAGSVQLIAQTGDNRLIAGSGANTLTGGSGLDTLIGGGATQIILTTGNSRALESISGSSDTITTGVGLDTIKMFYGTTNVATSIVGSSGSLRFLDLAGSNTLQGGSGADTVVLAGVYGPGNASVSNVANQTITAGSGGVRIVTDEASANASVTTAAGGNYTVTFSDTQQSLSIIDSTGTSVTIAFGDGSSPLKI